MFGFRPFYSQIYPDLQKLIRSRAGNNRPKELGGVSGLQPWIRVISAVSDPDDKNINGLVMDSVYPYNSFQTKYGVSTTKLTTPGILGYQLDLKTPVTIQGNGRGLRPSPVITDMSVRNEGGRGLADLKFSVTAHTLEQAEELSKYLLEPGFYLLVEWGWNTAKSRSQIVGGGGNIDFCDIVNYNNWNYIIDKIKKSDYQYNATMGLISGGSYEFGENETYNLNVNVKGIGTIAEFLQTHNSVVKTKAGVQDNEINFNETEIKDFEAAQQVGKILFAKMFNQLPNKKKTEDVKKLVENEKWSDPANFVNMDPDVIQDLQEGLNSFIATKNESLETKLPKDVNFLSSERFIRFELAVEILNTYGLTLDPVKGDCPRESRDFKIHIEDTIISGFPHMFSTNTSVLFIPNTKTPDFAFLKALQDPSSDDVSNIFNFSNLDSDQYLSNNHPFTTRTNFDRREQLNGSVKDYKSGTTRPTPYAFPCTYDLDETVLPVSEVDETFLPLKEDAYFWGWLKDLYINFDFFVSSISKPNLIVRDVFFDMLNQMSAACNSMWHFEIVQDVFIEGENKGSLRMSVVDTNFTGKVTKEVDGESPFLLRGVDSPFTEVTFSCKTHQAMMNSLIVTRMNSSVQAQQDLNVNGYQLIGTAFSRRVDKVGTAINSFKQLDENNQTEGEPNSEATDNPGAEQKQNVLFDLFNKNATVLPRIQNKVSKMDIVDEIKNFSEGDLSGLEKLMTVGGWGNGNTLKKIELLDKNLAEGGSSNQTLEDNQVRNVPIGLEQVGFKIHGVSGLKHNDRIRFEGIPHSNSKKRLFIITGIEDIISNNSWETSIDTMSVPLEGDI